MNAKADEQEIWAVFQHDAPGSTRYGYADWDFGRLRVSFVTLKDDEPYGLGASHPLDDLVITAQYNADEGKPYGFEVSMECTRVTLEYARAAAKVLDDIDKKIRRIHEEWGQPQTFGACVLYYLKALRVKGVLVDNLPNRSLGTRGDWRKYKVTEMEWLVTRALQPIIEKAQASKGESK